MTSNEDIELTRLEEAAHWLERLESGRGSDEAFERWRSDPANALAFVKISATSQWVSENLPKTLKEKPAPKRKGVTRRWWVSGAAAAVTVIAGGYLTLGLTTDRAEAMTAVGERSSLSLPDGGRIDLNTDTQVSWKFGKQKRQVWLTRGEIAITVPTDGRELTVQAGEDTIALRPGQYNIRLRESGVEVAVEKGQGHLVTGNTSARSFIAAGEVASIKAHDPGRSMPIDAAGFEALSAWKSDEIVLDGVTLSTAVAEYNRYLRQKISIEDAELRDIRIGGRFTTKDPTVFVNSLHTSFGIRADRKSDGSIVLRA